MEKLINIAAGKLLEKFGAGSHKPGSGSAAAYEGMLSAQLIKTVIELTLEEKRKDLYGQHHEELRRIKERIENHLYPSLEELFQKDSEQFDKVIQLRKARDRESDRYKRKELDTESLMALVPATEMPVRIGQLCKELAEFAMFIFDNGFSSVRGDSGVALNGAVAAIGGCLSIINLNLLSFGSNNWVRDMRQKSKILRGEYDILIVEVNNRLDKLRSEADKKYHFKSEIEKIVARGKNKNNSYSEIEEIVKNLQNTIWLNRDLVWKKDIPQNPRDLLSPKHILKALEFSFFEEKTLGRHNIEDGVYEIAGIIDNEKKTVKISQQFSPEVRNFTAAHELGHAVMHNQAILHRDRPLDGSQLTGSRDKIEKQADKFASYFLMPRKQVIEVFQELFQIESFEINERTAIALGKGRSDELRSKYKDLRSLCRLIASTTYFNGQSFKSLAEIFGVSVEAMAIRLEELNLVDNA